MRRVNGFQYSVSGFTWQSKNTRTSPSACSAPKCFAPINPSGSPSCRTNFTFFFSPFNSSFDRRRPGPPSCTSPRSKAARNRGSSGGSEASSTITISRRMDGGVERYTDRAVRAKYSCSKPHGRTTDRVRPAGLSSGRTGPHRVMLPLLPPWPPPSLPPRSCLWPRPCSRFSRGTGSISFPFFSFSSFFTFFLPRLGHTSAS
mmetsp:Transcript_38209/g.114320  ORF Transcript_38209/g.114320 Transcript_38209/m.114320 type:complete len:202 (-) Transcript_38209:1863-2468(-)